MQFDKRQIIDYLVARGDLDRANQAEAELPAVVDTDNEPDLLAGLDVQPEDLMGTHPPGPAGLGPAATLDSADRPDSADRLNAADGLDSDSAAELDEGFER